MAPFLTADLGNSALKLCLWDSGGRVSLRERLPCGEDLAEALASFLSRNRALEGAALSSVARAGEEEQVRSALALALGGAAGLTPDPGVENRCRAPETTGADRLFAARGAFELGCASAVILDAGTALTVDAFRVEAGRPAFLGGAIFPGPELLAGALVRGAARLVSVRPEPGAPALGRDSEGAIEAGVSGGLRGAARELRQRVAAEAGLEDAPVLLTGGAAAFVDDPALYPAGRLRLEPDLVHLGLRAAARGARR